MPRGIFSGPSDAQSSLEWILVPWRAYVALPLLLTGLALLVSFAVPNKYRAVAQVYPEQQKVPGGANLGAIAGLASQIGVGLASGAQSPQFYVQVLGSRKMMEEVLAARVAPDHGDSVPLIDYLADNRDTGTVRLDRAMRRLREATGASVNARTNILELAATAKDRAVSARIVALYLEQLGRFNVESRQTQAGLRRRFLEARLSESQDSVQRTDRAINTFLIQNRQYRDSPSLMYEYDKLQRQLTNYQTLSSSLRRDYDTARLDEVNDTPVLTVIDPPRPPLQRASPSRAVAGVGGAVFGIMFVLLWAAMRAFMGRMRREQPEQFATIAAIAGRFRLGRAA